MKKAKLLYILPEYDEATATHLYHIFQLLEELGEKIDIFLIIEKSKGIPKINNLNRISISKNIIQRFILILWARILGYKKAYVHYSYWGAIFASLFMKTYYWHCEVYDQFSMSFELSKKYFHKKLFDEWPMRLAMKATTFLVTGTKTVGEYYRKEFNLPKSKIKIVPNWVDTSRFVFKKSKNNSKKIILFAHKLVPRKGADYLPEIAKNVIKAYPNVSFWVAGDGLLKNELEKSSNLKLLGNIPNTKIPELFSKADVFIMPSRQEGFPRVLIEAMAASLPFVAFNVGGVMDILSKQQKWSVVPKNDTNKFSAKVISLLKNDKQQKKLIKSGLMQIDNFSMDRVVKKFLHLLT